ncbi:MAG: hypothetical protein IJV02_00090 [Candidatus Methanomethylophilaceae archaeon]|nr:hypothetical protein [Candidatus Methanomethylophilaceae archaeon]MBR1452526.1 hypothetical protein [Candidatus Methanomethylophilaceae archaeon]
MIPFDVERRAYAALSVRREKTPRAVAESVYGQDPDPNPRVQFIRMERMQWVLDRLVARGMARSREIWTDKGLKKTLYSKVER